MKSATYRTDKKWVLLITTLVLAGLIFMVIGNPQAFKEKSSWLLVAGLVIILLDSYSGMYISFNDNVLIRTTHFFVRRKINIHDIQSISYGPTWIMGGSFGYSLRIKGSANGRPMSIEVANVGYSNRVISDILHNLVKINPRISLDHATELLLK